MQEILYVLYFGEPSNLKGIEVTFLSQLLNVEYEDIGHWWRHGLIAGSAGRASGCSKESQGAVTFRLPYKILSFDQMSPLMHLSVEQLRARGHQRNRKLRPNPILQ